MCGVMKGKKQDEGNLPSRFGESKIARKQVTPIMPSVIQMAPRNVVVVGSTHVVEMRGRTLFNGGAETHLQNQGVFLRQGTRVVIDKQTAVLSRRGPNQSFFRKEDRGRGTHIYRWVRVLFIDGENVSGRNLYIREGTFRDEAFMEGRVLSPPSGGVRPSIDAAPGTRHMPLLRPPRPGEEGQDVLTPEQRSLNRLARGEWVTLPGDMKTKTPHLAMMVWGGKIYVAGNTDRHVPEDVISSMVLEKLMQLISVEKNQRLKKIEEELGRNKNWRKKPLEEQMNDVTRIDEIRQKKKEKMYRKLDIIRNGRYHEGEYKENEIMIAIRNAIINPQENIVICTEGQDLSALEMLAPIHGEMLILDMLYEEYNRRKAETGRKEQRRRLKKVFAGGNLQDCIFCHWAFDIFNRVIGISLGIMVVSSGTHGQRPGKWRIPRWMREEEKAMRMLREKIRDLNEGEDNGGRYEVIEDEVQKVLIYSQSSQMKNTMLDESDSDVE